MTKFSILMTTLILTISAQASTNEAITKSYKDSALKWGPCPEIFPKGCEISVLQGDPAKGEADIFLKVPASYQIPAHTHTSPEHMTLVSGVMTVHYEGQHPVTVSPGAYLYGPAKAPHKAACGDKDECVLSISFDSKIDAMKAKAF